MKNLVIFGGSFDPIHNGHLNMALEASKRLDADVYFVPARISVWKKESGAEIEDKIEMIKLAIIESGSNRLFVDSFEALSLKEVNYSIDTVKHFASNYPSHEIFLLIGTDQVNSFDKWKDAEEIASLAHIVFFSRPGLHLSKKNIAAFNMKEIEGEMVEASSTEIRALKNFKTPYSVVDYIIKHNLYSVKQIKEFLTSQRFLHSVSVAKTAYEIALANKIKDSDQYLIAGLLHDIGKDLPIGTQKRMMEQYYPQYVSLPPVIYHQFIGEYLAKKEFGVKDEQILSAIACHTTGKANMSTMDKIIHAADKIEPTRGFDSADLIKAMKVNSDIGFVTVLKANKEYFIKHKIDYNNPLTKSCMDFYLK